MTYSKAYDKFPEHTLELETQPGIARATFQGELIAESKNAMRLHEGKYPATFYFPQEDVRMDLLQKTSHSTHCPFKGDASYWSIGSEPGPGENAVWGYESPFEQMLGLKDLLSFYADRVDIEGGD
ncbi:MAG: DUF427 domain-containing protein [Deltaproteobacteria bacterium]|nr:DUF427 domain-containing protein [Deltaproteobacteria bacterium]MBW2393981.1 DUF427 domain-containing protein [Deltaproteobacteria bacterium]